jgi:hypothetical protein
MNRLVRLYPAAWRKRYGDELEWLVAEMSDRGSSSWRTRADLLRGASRERLRAAGLGGTGTPSDETRGGVLLVLAAWTLFVLAGLAIQKLYEHWQSALPGSGHGQATFAFDTLIVTAICASALVLFGLALAVPAALRHLETQGWNGLRRHLLAAGALTLLAGLGTAGLAIWAHNLTPAARGGDDAGYVAAFLVWAAICGSALASWTAFATTLARRVDLPARTLRWEARLACAVTAAMAVMSAAAFVWWATVAGHAPPFFGAAASASVAETLGPIPVMIGGAMLVATVLGGVGARHALAYAPSSRRG